MTSVFPQERFFQLLEDPRMTSCKCDCRACLAPDGVRDSVGEVLGYRKCCRDAFKKPVKKTRKTKALLQKQKLLRKIQDRSGFTSIAQYYPCLTCAAQLYKKYKRAYKGGVPKCNPITTVFADHIKRPWPLYESVEVNKFNEKFNDHAWDVLSPCRYTRMTDELWGKANSSSSDPEASVENPQPIS